MSLHALPDYLLERWFAEFEFLPGIRNLAASGAYAATTQELLAPEGAETTARYLALGLDYVENPGNEQLRQAVSRLYTTLEAGDIRITTGASEALLLLIWTTVQPGDNVLVEEPNYGNIAGVARSRGAEVRSFPYYMKRGWKPDLEQIASLVDQRTRLITLTHAHHPTGSLLQVEEMQAIARIAERVGALVVSDEVFRPIALDGPPAPSVIDVVEQAVVIADMTKPWGLGGLRVGWIASRDQALLRRICGARDYSTISGNAPGEFLAEVALRHAERIITPRLATARVNRQRLADAVAGSRGALRWVPPQAGYTAFIRLPFPAEPFCRYLAEKKGLLLLPGYVYGKPYECFIRIGFGCSTELFEEGLTILTEEWQRWQSDKLYIAG
jgi:aspartate/methionine/tyrosine aminotransferase